MPSELGKKAPQNSDSPTVRERLLRRAGVPAIAVLTAVALAACSNTGAQEQPQPEPTSISASQDPTEQPNGPDATPTTPAAGEFVSVPSGLEVDYDAFADWEDKVGTNGIENSENGSIYNYLSPTSKRSVCEAFFRNNGIPIIVDGKGEERIDNGDLLENNGEEFIAIKFAQKEMIRTLNRDDTDPRNAEIARNLVECVTTPDGTERAQLLAELEGVRDGSIDPEGTALTFVEFNNWNLGAKDGGASAIYTVELADGTHTRIREVFNETGSRMWRTHFTEFID